MTRIAPAERRELLARAALAVIARDGVHAATTRAITAEAGMSLASFHYAVESRDELLRDVVDLVVGQQDTAAFASLALDATTLHDAVRGVLGSYLDIVRADPAREQAMFELTQHALRTEALREFPAAQYRVYRDLARRLLEAGAARYRIHWDTPTDDLAALAITLTDGATLAWLATRDDAAVERLLDLAATTITAHARPLPRPEMRRMAARKSHHETQNRTAEAP